MSRSLFKNIPIFSTLQNNIEMFLKTFQKSRIFENRRGT